MITAHFYKMGRAAADNRSRGKSYSNANAATPRAGKCNRQALQLFELLACNVKAFLWGFQRGDSLLRKRIPPMIRAALRALQCPLAPNGRDSIPPNQFGDRIFKNPKSLLFDSPALQYL